MGLCERATEISCGIAFPGLLSAWVLYAGYYICRKDISPGSESKISPLAFSLISFGAAYAISQFVGGTLADRFGARRTALAVPEFQYSAPASSPSIPYQAWNYYS